MNPPRLHTVDVKSGKFVEIVWRDPKIISEVIANEPEMRRVQLSAMVCKANKALDSAAGLTVSDPAWLWQLKIKGKCALNEKEVECAFLEAAKSDTDTGMIQKAVTALASPLNDADIQSQINKVEWLLLEQWLAKEKADFFRSLCYYNDTALAKLVGFLLGNNQGHNGKSIRKVCEKLGLKKAQQLLYRDIVVNERPRPNQPGAVPIYFKKLIKCND
jgi:hypothetical protein